MNLLQILKIPLSMLQVFSSAKSFVDNPILGNRWLNEHGLHRSRCAIAARMATWRRSRLAARIDPADRETFEATGLVIKSDFLSTGDFKRLRREVLEQSWETLEMCQGPALTRRAPLDPGELATHAPSLAQFVTDHRVIDLIRYAASTGGRPIFSLQAILSNAGKLGDDPQCIPHQDTFHAVAKAWFFLHDVGPDDGPFFYVRGSHRRTQDRLNWEHRQGLMAAINPNRYHARGSFRISESELDELGFTKPEPITVRANTLVVADTSGFHGRIPSQHPTSRLEIYATLRRNPFLPWLGLHVWDLPWVRSRPGSIELKACHLLRRFGIRWIWPEGGRKPISTPINSTE
jgi:hypothetical protein